MQAGLVHNLVHDKGGPGHVAGAFQKGDAQKQQQDVGHEDNDPADASDYAVYQQGADHTLGHMSVQPVSQRSHSGIDPFHGRGAQGEGQLE